MSVRGLNTHLHRHPPEGGSASKRRGGVSRSDHTLVDILKHLKHSPSCKAKNALYSPEGECQFGL